MKDSWFSTRCSLDVDMPTQKQKKSIASIYIEQAEVYCQEKNWRKAMLACKNALEIYPEFAEAYRIVGNIFRHQGKFAEALGIYAKALKIDPNSAKVYAHVGALYAEREDWQKALDYYQQSAIINPNSAEVYSNLAQIWEELGDTEKALECFYQAIDLNPTFLDPEDYFSFARELYQQKKLKEASILFAHGVKLNPAAEAELVELVQILEELEEWQEAVFYYHQLMSLPDVNTNANFEFSNYKPFKDKPITKLLSNSQSSSNRVIAKNTQSSKSLMPKNIVQKLLPTANLI